MIKRKICNFVFRRKFWQSYSIKEDDYGRTTEKHEYKDEMVEL